MRGNFLKIRLSISSKPRETLRVDRQTMSQAGYFKCRGCCSADGDFSRQSIESCSNQKRKNVPLSVAAREKKEKNEENRFLFETYTNTHYTAISHLMYKYFFLFSSAHHREKLRKRVSSSAAGSKQFSGRDFVCLRDVTLLKSPSALRCAFRSPFASVSHSSFFSFISLLVSTT